MAKVLLYTFYQCSQVQNCKIRVVIGDAGDRTRGLSHAKRTRYHCATSPSTLAKWRSGQYCHFACSSPLYFGSPHVNCIESRVAQWKRAGPITQRSIDRNYPLLTHFCFSFQAVMKGQAKLSPAACLPRAVATTRSEWACK